MILLKGLPVANDIRSELSREISNLMKQKTVPKLAVVLAGEDPGSVWYANAKVKLGEKLGIAVTVHKLPINSSENDVLTIINNLNEESTVHGILVELPLPKHLNTSCVLEAIQPVKDVDGVTSKNRGYILNGQEDLALVPATPQACIKLIEQSGRKLSGSKITLVGRGDTVGRPLAMMLVKRDATVTICHTKTVDLAGECQKADILITAAGSAGLISKEMVKPGTVVIDAGVNQDSNGNYIGDVKFEEVKKVAMAITPVPGGVGALTTTIIMKNTLLAIKMQNEFQQKE